MILSESEVSCDPLYLREAVAMRPEVGGVWWNHFGIQRTFRSCCAICLSKGKRNVASRKAIVR